MRKTIAMMSVSLDGFMEGVDRDISWHRVDEELHRYVNEELSHAGGFLDGRVTYELMAAYWPTADADPDSGEVEVEFAGIWREMPKIVYSRTLQEAGWNTTIARNVEPDEVLRLKAEPGGDLYLGGADLIDAFRQLDLIDEYRIYVHPVIVGRGKPFFHPADTITALELVETRAFGNGVVRLRYVHAREAAAR
jgi:dihydrofolate reductase